MRNYLIVILFIFIAETTFAQNSLQYYLNNAEQSSPLLQKQSNNENIIELDLKQFNAIYKSPNISLNSSVIFSPIINKESGKNTLKWASSGSSNYIGHDLNATDGGIYQALVSVNQPLFTHKYSEAQKFNADIARQQLANTIELTKAELKQTVTHQYILCVLSQKQKENLQNVIQLINNQIEKMALLVESGQCRIVDYKLLQIELSDKQIELEQINNTCNENRNALNLLCGITDTTQVSFADTNLELNITTPNSSLFASQFQLDSLSLVADQKLFNLQYLPQVNAFADAGLNATYQPTLNRLGMSLGLSFKWNLFDGHQRQINNNKVKFNLQNIAVDQNYFTSQNTIRKQNLLQQIDNADKQIKLCLRQLTECENLLKMYQTEVDKGLVSVLELKTLTQDILTKQQNITNLQMAKEILINAYNYWNL